jgi:hypothetical protein
MTLSPSEFPAGLNRGRDLSGGCQCGRIRYRVHGAISECNVCHCRMCQKASGGPFMTFFNVATEAVTWTRGELATFASSNIAARGFCRDCGTPLTYQRRPERISLTIGSLDEPAAVAPESRLSSETVLRWSETVGNLPIETIADWRATVGALTIVDHQHPDHDT